MRVLRKTIFIALLPMLLGVSFEPSDPTRYRPMLLKRADLHHSIFLQSVRDFENPGKIYLYQDWVFIVDLYRGIHIIDNRNPEEPTKTGFIHIPGVMDLAIQNDILFADNSTDLVSIDIKDHSGLKVIGRIENVFPEPTPPDLDYIPARFSARNRPPDTVIVGWVE